VERTNRIASYALALFAFLWLTAILALDVLPTAYAVDLRSKVVGREVVVTSVGPDAARAGLQVGDAIPFDALWYARQFGPEGGMLRLPVRRGSQTLALTLPLTRPIRAIPVFQSVLTDVAITFALLLAAYLGFRKPSVMIAALILFLGGGALSWPDFVALFSALPDSIYVPFAWTMIVLCEWFPVMALASFAIRLPGSAPSKSQQSAIRIVDGIVIGSFCTAFGLLAAGVYRQTDLPCTALSGIVVLLASMAALLLARPADRGRTGIVFGGVVFGGVGYAANMVGLRLGEPYWLFTVYANLSVVVVPLALAYAILRHRVFDVAFVLNRTMVFALTSALVIVLFAALEFLVERFLSDVTHVAGIILQFGIALAVTLSVRLMHRRVDSLVDNVLFRSRHEQENALRRFASTLQFYTEEGPLVRDTIDVLLRYGRVEGAAIYLAGETGLKQVQSSFSVAAPEIEHNDMAYVELRAHHEPLHVHKMPTALPGDRLYPMVRAGRIVGVVATGERESGEEMPPDIDEAIIRIAHAAATSLGAIESDRIRSELTALRVRLGFS
jgi:hypothetical protein